MSNYTPITVFALKDALPSGNPGKVIYGATIDPELNAIATAIATKYDSASIASAPVAFANGTAALPSITFTGSTNNNTGVYLAGSNSLGFAANGVAAGAISSGGAWSIPAPTSGVGLTVAGLAGQYVAQLNASATAGQSNGLFIKAGTNTSDITFNFQNQAGTQSYLYGLGNGEVYVATPPAATSPPSGTLQVGYMELPQHSINASTTLALTDRGKHVYLSGGSAQTLTIPANASISFPIGTTIMVLNESGNNWSIAITTDTLQWLPSGGTGARTLGNLGMATLLKVGAAAWIISGQGLS